MIRLKFKFILSNRETEKICRILHNIILECFLLPSVLWNDNLLLLQWRNWWKYSLVNFLAKTKPESCVRMPRRSKFDWPSVNHLTSNPLCIWLADCWQPTLASFVLCLGIEFWTRTVCSANWVALTYICIVAPTSKLIFLSDDKHLDDTGQARRHLDTFKALC